MLLLLCGGAVSLHAQFEVPDQPYRCPPKQTSCRTVRGLPSVEQRTAKNGNTFSVHYVEFDDHGKPFPTNNQEMAETLEAVRNAPANGRQTLLVVYINGWQNNADEPLCGSPPCGDVPKFRDTLLARLAENFPTFNVMGVYLAWRGLTFTVEPFKHVISYWPRRAVARHVGQTGMYKALIDLKTVVASNRQQYFFVLAGHSFGARVLENAADAFKGGTRGFMTEYRERLKTHSASDRAVFQTQEERSLHTELPADLIFYVNAATSSAITRRTIRDTQESCAGHPEDQICDANPFYLAVTTRADWATGLVMPIANLVFPAISSDGLRLFSAANSPWMHTHDDPQANASPSQCAASDDAPVGGFCFHVIGANSRSEYRVSPIRGKTQHQFWIFNVKKNVMNGHTDVWNATVTDLVCHVIARNHRFALLRGVAAAPLE